MSYSMSKRSLGHLKGVHPSIIKLIQKGIKDSPFDFGVPKTGGLRTAKTQGDLYDIGRTPESMREGKKPVTYVDGVRKKSNHQAKEDGYGHAFDIYIYDHETKRASWDVNKLSAVANHIMRLAPANMRLEWGGNWKRFKDYPHFQANIRIEPKAVKKAVVKKPALDKKAITKAVKAKLVAKAIEKINKSKK